MNIKSIANNLLPFDVKKVVRNNRTEASSDRDAEGKREEAPKKQPRRNLSEDELNAAIAYLKNLKGVKDNNLTVRLVRQNNVPVAIVEDHTGKIIRRIPETELSMLDVLDRGFGHAGLGRIAFVIGGVDRKQCRLDALHPAGRIVIMRRFPLIDEVGGVSRDRCGQPIVHHLVGFCCR